MHRSGTSALANVLALAGADLPREVMPADDHNARGYFEPWRIAVFNDRRLAAAGTAWDDPFAALAAPPADETTWREEARGLFRAQFGRRRRPLLKDPRVTVLWDLWRPALEAEGLALRVLVPVRSPLAVAGSLAARDGFPLRKSVMVWCAYMLAAEAGSRDLPRAFLDYDALLEDWRPPVASAEARLGEPLPALTPAAGRKIDAFLSTELRRNSGEGDLSALGEAGAMASGVLDWLRAAARGAEPDRAPLDRAAAWLAAQKTLYGDLVSPVSADRSAARTALADAEGRAAFLERTLAETREIVATLEGRIQALYDTIGSLDGQLGEMRDHIASLTRTNEDLRRHARSLETRLKASQAAVREAAGRLESLVAPG
jgi:FtsZ-binding cell division protein ZapB